MRIIQFCLKNPLFLNMLTVLILIVGIAKTAQTNKEAFPAIDFDIVAITTIYPGASPQEVEQDVTDPLEEEIAKVDNLEEVTSTSLEGRSTVIIKLDPDLTDSKRIETVDDIQRAVDATRGLPDDLPNPPIVNEMESGDMPVLELGLAADLPYRQLHKLAEELKDKIEDLGDVKEVSLSGWREKEYVVEADPKKLNKYNIGFNLLVGSLNSRNLNLPGGVLETQSGDVLVRTIGELETAEDIENIILRSNSAGVEIHLRDIATVRDTFEEEKYIYRTNGKPSINLLVKKKAVGDIITLVDEVKKTASEFTSKNKNKPLEVTYMNDMSVFVKNRLGVLTNNGIVGIVLVLLVLLLFLSKGIATVAAIGMPVAFFATIMVMSYSGITINLISMFGLVIVLGMLVDDAIIVAENIWQHYEKGASAWDAAVNGTSEVFWPVTVTIMTSIAAFSPLLMISGIFGKFIMWLPVVVIIALVMSLLEAMFILPSHAYDILKLTESKKKSSAKQKKNDRQNDWVKRAIEKYGVFLAWTLRFRYLFCAFILALFFGSIWFSANNMKLIMFPTEGVEAFFVRAELPRTSTLENTADQFRILEKTVKSLPKEELKDFTTHIGIHRTDAVDPFTKRGSHLGQMQVFLTPENDRSRTAEEIQEDLRKRLEPLTKKHGFVGIWFTSMRIGPPTGKPVAIRVKGDSLDKLSKVGKEIEAVLHKTEGVKDISTDFYQGKDEFRIIVNEKAAAKSLLTARDIAVHVRSAIEGQIATYIRRDGDRIAVRARFGEEQRKATDYIMSSKIPNAVGHLVPLDRVATFETHPGISAIFHKDYIRTITVSADVNEKITSSTEVNTKLFPVLEKLETQHPDITLTAGGEWEDTEESMTSLKESFVIAMALIFVILVTKFKSFTQPFVIMAAIPFGFIGVVIAFYTHGLPLSFLGFVGGIGLSGVVINDSIVLVDFVNKGRERGMEALEAVIYASKRRFRAVWLTSLTTVFGLLPLVYGIGGQDKFLRPAATALSYGLIFGTVLILLLVPALYMIRIDILNLFKKALRIS